MHLIAPRVIRAVQGGLQRLLPVLQGAPVQLRVVVDDDVVRRRRGLRRDPERRRRESRWRRVRLRVLLRRHRGCLRWLHGRQLGCCLRTERRDGGTEGSDLSASSWSYAGAGARLSTCESRRHTMSIAIQP